MTPTGYFWEWGTCSQYIWILGILFQTNPFGWFANGNFKISKCLRYYGPKLELSTSSHLQFAFMNSSINWIQNAHGRCPKKRHAKFDNSSSGKYWALKCCFPQIVYWMRPKFCRGSGPKSSGTPHGAVPVFRVKAQHLRHQVVMQLLHLAALRHSTGLPPFFVEIGHLIYWMPVQRGWIFSYCGFPVDISARLQSRPTTT